MKIIVTGSIGFIGFHLVSNLIKNKKNQLIKTGAVKGETFKTHGSNKLVKKNFKGIKFKDIKYGLKKVILNFKKFGC